MDSLSFTTILLAVMAGVLPPLIWLYFLLHEDRRYPEPKLTIFLAFMAGMLAVILVLPIESFAQSIFVQGLPLIISWAGIEEITKYVVCALFILWRREVDEPLDIVIYMLTVALGFAALENTLFLVTPFTEGATTAGIITDNLRFVGSTLLHVLATSCIAFSLAFSVSRPRVIRVLFASVGLILAVALHTLFNFFIINQNGSEAEIAFFVVWTGAIILFALFEILKYEEYHNLPTNV